MKTFSKLVYTALCAGLMQGAPAKAGETAHQGMQIVVSYADLDISHEAGARVLINRLEQAASKACGGEPFITDLETRIYYQNCKKEAMDRAVASVNSPLVATLSGQPPNHEVAVNR